MEYKIMHKDRVISLADDNGITEIVNKELCPACFTEGMPLNIWLDNRTVDIHRSHSRRLFKALRLKTSADTEQIITVGHGISITDNWWVQKSNENLDYQALKRYNEELADIALFGSPSSESGDTSGYRELGTVGSYEKAWRFIDNSWHMFKYGNTQELISEYYSYLFLTSMDAPIAEYRIHRYCSEETGLKSSYIVTKDFTDNAKVDFEPFCNYYADNEEPDYIIPRLDENLIKPYVMMLFYDTLLYNGDRHNQNVGVLKNSDTGEIIGLAPYFDYNLALVSVGIPRIDSDKGNLFTRDLLGNEVCRRVLKENLPERDRVLNAVRYASIETSKAFPEESFNYSLLENYIVITFDHIDKRL